MAGFIGVKIALLKDGEVLVIQRDDKPGLRFAGMWDLPGGAREVDESPFECVSREIKEELNIDLKEGSIVWQKTYPAIQDPGLDAYFMVANVTSDDIASIKFGSEGQGWKLMKIADFMSDPTVIEPLKGRFRIYMDNTG